MDAEEYIARSLEALTLRQAGLLPAEIINPYLLELRRLEEAERQRVAEERLRVAIERQRAEAERQRAASERQRAATILDGQRRIHVVPVSYTHLRAHET